MSAITACTRSSEFAKSAGTLVTERETEGDDAFRRRVGELAGVACDGVQQESDLPKVVDVINETTKAAVRAPAGA